MNRDVGLNVKCADCITALLCYDDVTGQARGVMEYCESESRDNDMGHVVEVEDCSRMLIARCSETFRQALHYDVYNTTKSTSSTREPVTLTENQLQRDDEEQEEEEEEMEETEMEETKTRVRQTAGRRAWNRLRVYVDEQSVRRRHNNTEMNWRFIRHTLGVISQPQQSRLLLYERYLEHPDDWLCGFINCPTHLASQRRTAAAAASDVGRQHRMTTTKL